MQTVNGGRRSGLALMIIAKTRHFATLLHAAYVPPPGAEAYQVVLAASVLAVFHVLMPNETYSIPMDATRDLYITRDLRRQTYPSFMKGLGFRV